MARDYTIYKDSYDTGLKPRVDDNAPTVAQWKQADANFANELKTPLSKAKNALGLLDGQRHAARYREDLAQAGNERKLGGNITKHLSTLKTHLAAWEQAQTKHQATVKTHVDTVKDVYSRWTVAKTAQKDFKKNVADVLAKSMLNFETSLSKEVAERKKKVSTKLGLGNKSLPDLEKLLADTKQLKDSDEYKAVVGWRVDLAKWKKEKETEIGREVLSWEPVDLKQWHTTRVNEVKQALGLKDFKF